MEKKGIGISVVAAIILSAILLIGLASATDWVHVITPDGGEYWGGSNAITMENTTDNYGDDIFNISYSHDNTTFVLIASNLSNASSLSYAWNTVACTDDKSVWIRVYKCHNNSGTWENCVMDKSNASFYVDNTAPSVAIVNTSLGLGAGSGSARHVYTTDATLGLTQGTCSDATSGINTVKIGSTDSTNSSAYWNVASLTLSSGCNVYTVTATDKAGNSNTDAMTVCKSGSRGSGMWFPGMTGSTEPATSTGGSSGIPGFTTVGGTTVGNTGLTRQQIGGLFIAVVLGIFVYTKYIQKKPKTRRRKK
jgi:hypothetical protein